jgi:hypothetical protein
VNGFLFIVVAEARAKRQRAKSIHRSTRHEL